MSGKAGRTPKHAALLSVGHGQLRTQVAMLLLLTSPFSLGQPAWVPHALPLPDPLPLASFPRSHRTPYPGGAPANVVTGVARLGAGALFISAIGKDELGDDFVALLQSELGLYPLQFGHGGLRPLRWCHWEGGNCDALVRCCTLSWWRLRCGELPLKGMPGSVRAASSFSK